VPKAAAQALAAIPPGDRANRVVDKLLPLLGSKDSDAQKAEAVAVIPLGDRANQVIDSPARR
jgi:hypothetical protein